MHLGSRNPTRSAFSSLLIVVASAPYRSTAARKPPFVVAFRVARKRVVSASWATPPAHATQRVVMATLNAYARALENCVSEAERLQPQRLATFP
jgi:hypothetical protein